MTSRSAHAIAGGQPRWRAAGRVGIAFLAGAVVVWVVWCVHLGLSARSHVLAAESTLRGLHSEQALQTIFDGDVSKIRSAASEMGRADDEIRSPWLAPLHAAPIVGRQMAAVRSLTSTASRILDAAIAASDELTPSKRADMSRLQLLQAVGRGTAEMAEAVDSADLGPSTGLIPPLAKAQAEFAHQILSLDEPLTRARAALPGLETLLAGPSHLVLIAANNAQMAAGSGLPLAAASMDITDGQIDVGTFVWLSSLKVPAGSVPLPAELQSLWGFATPQDSINRSMPSPRFAVTAPMVAAQYAAATGRPIDAVVMIDIVGLQKLAAAHGPFADPRALQPDQIIPELMHDQYVSANPDTPVDHGERESRLGEATQAIVSDLLSSTGDLPRLAQALGEAAAGRHLLLWSRYPQQQAAFAALGADGHLSEHSLFLALQNESSNKLDWFVRTNASISIDDNAAGQRVVTVDVTVSCNVPDGEPRYVAGSALRLVKYGDYVGYLTLHVPQAATDVRMSDNAPVIVQGPDGPTTVIGRLLVVPRNSVVSVTFTFVLPASSTHLVVEPSARYPAVGWAEGTTAWRDDQAHTVTFPERREADAA